MHALIITMKGHQVAPAELEACLLDHASVADCAVIGVPDDSAGEVPKAYVVKSTAAQASDHEVKDSIQNYIAKEKARYKRLVGGIEFVDAIPKSPSGKILRRILRDKECRDRKPQQSRL